MSISVAERVVRRLGAQYVAEIDRVLLDLVFKPAPTQRDLEEALRVCDIEVMGGHKSLMLSYLMREHPELRFPAYAAPRLKGLVAFYRFANIKVLQHFSRIGKKLNAAGIPILIFKGAAMKILRPDLSRPMGDVDILIPPERLEEALHLCYNLGYRDSRGGGQYAADIQAPDGGFGSYGSYARAGKHSVDLEAPDGEAAVDIHHALFARRDTGGPVAATFHDDLLARARECGAFGVRVLLPAPEDMFFIALANLMKNLQNKSSTHGLFYALFDCRFLLRHRPGFDWKIVRDNIRATRTEVHAGLAAEFMESLVPGLIPNLRGNLPATPKLAAFCDQVVFDVDFFNALRESCRVIRVVDLKNYPRHYGKMILKLLVLGKLRKLPLFVRWYLRRQGLEAGSAC